MYFIARLLIRIFAFLGTLKWRLPKHLPRLFFFPLMSFEEYRLFSTWSKRAHTVLEFGSGGSTIHFLKEGKRLYSVESNPDYYAFMKDIKMVRGSRDLSYRYVPIGPTNEWGEPVSREEEANWPRYYTEIWEELRQAGHLPDLVFIDGRFRVCCTLFALQQLGGQSWEGVFLIHDFWNRPEYGVVLDYLQPVARAGTLAVFRIKEEVDRSAIPGLLQIYAPQFL